jgi:fructose-1,6-bisphosphatase
VNQQPNRRIPNLPSTHSRSLSSLTLQLYGGIFAYPADTQAHPEGNLQLLYKSAPMAFVVHHAGGKAIDGRTGSLLDVRPERVHQKSPCFLGSPEDVAELEGYLLKSLSKVIQ